MIENEWKIFRLLETIVNMLLDLKVTNLITSQLWCPSFQYIDYSNKVKSVSSIISKNNVYIRLEDMIFNQLLKFNIVIIAEFKKNKNNKSVQIVYLCC